MSRSADYRDWSSGMKLFSSANASTASLRKIRWNTAMWQIFWTIVGTQNSWYTTNRTNRVQVSRRDVWVVVGNPNFQPNNTPAVSRRRYSRECKTQTVSVYHIRPYAMYSLALCYRTAFIWDDTLSDFQRKQDQQFLACCELILPGWWLTSLWCIAR